MTTSDPIRVGLVGFGFVSEIFHAPLLSKSQRFTLTHVAERSTDKARQAYPGIERCTSLEEMLATDVELVVIATPTAGHFEAARAAIVAGKHVVCEKPFTVTAAEAAELAALAHAQGVVLTVFHNRRWDGDFLTLQGVLATEELGEVVEYAAHYDRFRPELKDGNVWRERDEPGSGVLYDLGSHLIDQALQLFGRPSAIAADLRRQRDPKSAVDYFDVDLRYASRPELKVTLRSGCVATAHMALPRYVVHGRRGSFVKRGLDVQEDQLKAGGHPGTKGWGVEPETQHGVLTTQGATREVRSERGRYEAFYEAVAAAVRDGKPAPVLAADAALVVQLIELAAQSAANDSRLVPVPAEPAAWASCGVTGGA